jgi:threonine synthase
MSLWRFADLIAQVPEKHRITLGEGNTPLVRSHSIGPQAGIERLYLKLESLNPTGSYKDRFAAVAMSAMRANGKTRCVASSSGNAGAALAAYCAAANIICELAIIETAPKGKLLQMQAYGAQLKRIRGFGSNPEIMRRTFDRLAAIGSMADAELQVTAYHYSPVGMSGVQTISYELHEQAAVEGVTLDHVFVQAGGGGLALAVARGFVELHARGMVSTAQRTPAVHVVQPVGNDTIATPLRMGSQQAQAVNGTTTISGLQVPSVIDGHETLAACRASGGTGYTVTDEETWKLQSRLAREEGVFCEPGAVVSLAGALKAVQLGEIAENSTVVVLITGTGFKDMTAVERMTQGDACPLVELAEL